MNPNLIAQQRADYTGKIVTRHVKAPVAASNVSLNAATPVLSSQEDAVLKKLASLVGDETNQIKLASLSVDTRNKLEEMSACITKDSDLEIISNLLNPARFKLVADFDGDIRKLHAYHRLDDGVPLSETLQAVRGLWAYEFQTGYKLDEKTAQALVDTVSVALDVFDSAPDGFSYPPDDESGEFVQGFDNFYSFFGGDLDGNGNGELWVRNKDFVQLVKDYADKSQHIIAIVRDRQSTDPRTIRAILETDTHPSLLQGVL